MSCTCIGYSLCNHSGDHDHDTIYSNTIQIRYIIYIIIYNIIIIMRCNAKEVPNHKIFVNILIAVL